MPYPTSDFRVRERVGKFPSLLGQHNFDLRTVSRFHGSGSEASLISISHFTNLPQSFIMRLHLIRISHFMSLAQREKELSGKTNFFELSPVLNCLQQYLDTVQKSKLHMFFEYLKNETQNNFSHCNIYNIQTQKAYYLSSTKAPDSSLSRLRLIRGRQPIPFHSSIVWCRGSEGGLISCFIPQSDQIPAHIRF